jgi:hypothetical protein
LKNTTTKKPSTNNPRKLHLLENRSRNIKTFNPKQNKVIAKPKMTFNTFMISICMQMLRCIGLESKFLIWNQHQIEGPTMLIGGTLAPLDLCFFINFFKNILGIFSMHHFRNKNSKFGYWCYVKVYILEFP